MDVYYNSAVIAWCRIFGSDSRNQAHWKNIYNDRLLMLACSALKLGDTNAFKKRLLKLTKINNKEFKKLWDAMTKYRNKYVAHHDIDTCINSNDFEKAYAVSFGVADNAPDLKRAKMLVIKFYSILFEICLYIIRSMRVPIKSHYVPEKAFEKVMFDLAAKGSKL